MKGIIYKIVCNETGEVYYGSTTQKYLSTRINGHKYKHRQAKEGQKYFCASFQIIERGNYSYSLLETVECEDKGQLEARERFYIENNECVNKYKPGSINHFGGIEEYNKVRCKLYKEANKEKLKEYMKDWEITNRERRNEQQRQRRAKQSIDQKLSVGQNSAL
jgi:hypothetical protein